MCAHLGAGPRRVKWLLKNIFENHLNKSRKTQLSTEMENFLRSFGPSLNESPNSGRHVSSRGHHTLKNVLCNPDCAYWRIIFTDDWMTSLVLKIGWIVNDLR